ncbi:MAG: phage tail protein [Wolbachia endosymbiont of Tyrophagus putrescentiae]|nr:phage tail protein [Wolbachia endosymbiont of Tyrophagus putrescentiae]
MLLPPNSTKQEREIVEAIDYKVDSSCIKGFKFSFKEEVLLWLIEEYGLEEILSWIKDKKKAIKEGIKFQRVKGTPESLKIALKWASIEDISIIEEPPGEHFAEFQIGVHGIPEIETIIALAKLSAPVRSRLKRIFNECYNVQRFVLNESVFGDLLSDYSGRKIKEDGPILSFGRRNRFALKISNPTFKFGTFRNHYEQELSNDIYRLDVAILGETEAHTRNYNIICERQHQWYNFKALYPLPQSLMPEIKFAKAEVVLSDSWKLGDINACFPESYREEEGSTFDLNDNRLSEKPWKFKYKPILERFNITYNYEAQNFKDQKITKVNLTGYHVSCKNEKGEKQKDPIHEPETYVAVLYPGVVLWHEHQHLSRKWTNQESITN